MYKSDYTYKLRNTQGRRVCAIVDLDRGNMSVTNNIENVVQEIAKREDIDPKKYMFIYKDTEGFYDGWSVRDGDFVHLMKLKEDSAIAAYCEKDAEAGRN